MPGESFSRSRATLPTGHRSSRAHQRRAHVPNLYSLRDVVYPGSLELRGTRLYLAYHHEGVRVLDVSNPTQPREIAHFNTFRETDPGRGDGPLEGATGLHVPGDGKVYVVDSARGLLILTEPP